MKTLVRAWLDGWYYWLSYGHPHWDWLHRLSKYWGNPLCAGNCIGATRIWSWVWNRFGYFPGDQFAESPRVPRAARGWRVYRP